jgi:hypothetical protein
MKDYTYKRKITVVCKNCSRMDEDATEFVDIEQGMQMEDILTFICPICKTTQKSRRFG